MIIEGWCRYRTWIRRYAEVGLWSSPTQTSHPTPWLYIQHLKNTTIIGFKLPWKSTKCTGKMFWSYKYPPRPIGPNREKVPEKTPLLLGISLILTRFKKWKSCLCRRGLFCLNWFYTFYFWGKNISEKVAQIVCSGVGEGKFGQCPKEKVVSVTSSLTPRWGTRMSWRWWPTSRRGFAQMKHSKS